MGGDVLIGALTDKYLLVDQEIFIPTKPFYLYRTSFEHWPTRVDAFLATSEGNTRKREVSSLGVYTGQGKTRDERYKYVNKRRPKKVYLRMNVLPVGWRELEDPLRIHSTKTPGSSITDIGWRVVTSVVLCMKN